MDVNAPCSLAPAFACQLRDAREELARRWLERISARVSISPERVFPGDQLLDHVPILIDGIAAYLESAENDLDAEAPVVAKARELGAMRHAQGFDAYQVLKEHELLGAILLSFFAEVAERLEAEGTMPPRGSELLACWRRVSHAGELIRQAAAVHFLQLVGEQASEREERLRRFNRMVSHELKNRVSAIRGASALLGEHWITGDDRARFQRMIAENAEGLQHVLENLESLSRMEKDARQQRNVLLPHAAAEAVRQLRDAAQARGVDVRIDPGLPTVEVNAAAAELCLMNYVSNAIKYSRPDAPGRWVEISGEFRPRAASGAGGELVVRVRDNGRGVPESARGRLFQQFYRAHERTADDVQGTGLGLSIVRETVESFGGRAWAEFPDGPGSVFAFSLPSRREADAAAAGVTRAS